MISPPSVHFTNDRNTEFTIGLCSDTPLTRYHCYKADRMKVSDWLLSKLFGWICNWFKTESIELETETGRVRVFMKKTEIVQLLEEHSRIQSVANKTLFSPQPTPSTQVETSPSSIPENPNLLALGQEIITQAKKLPTSDVTQRLVALTSVLKNIALLKQHYAIAKKETRENPQLKKVLQSLRDTVGPIFEQLILDYLSVYTEGYLHDLFNIANIRFTTMFTEPTPGHRNYLVKIHWSDEQSGKQKSSINNIPWS